MFKVLSNFNTSSLIDLVAWNCANGGLTSEGSSPMRNGQTYVFFKVFDRAPASKSIQSECRLFGVRQIMPAFAASSREATSVPHRAPLSMSSEESQGFIALMILGSQPRRASAAARLRSPDQLMN